MDDLEQVNEAISLLESQRSFLGDEVVEAALAPLQAKLAFLESQAAESGPELKYVTVLFLDVVESTRLEQHLDPEDILEIMNTAMERFEAVIQSHGGQVLRFMGDGLKAGFGVQKTREDDPERAVRAGLALLEEARQYAARVEAQWGLPGFQVRVGIHTGKAILGGGREASNSAMGLTINLAQRMESTAPPGSLRISHATYRSIRGLFDVQPQPPLQVKGWDEPMQTYLVEGARLLEFRLAGRGVQGVETRMVGRGSEMHKLQDHFHSTALQSQTEVITVTGEPGVGKSRLIYEFKHWIENEPGQVQVFKGRASPLLVGTPYGMLRDLFADHLRIRRDDPLDMVVDKLVNGLADGLSGESELKAHYIGSLLGFDLSESRYLRGLQGDFQHPPEQALYYLTGYFTRLARLSPLLILLEDIHWADSSSLEAIIRLVEESPGLPLLLVAVARPQVWETHPHWVRLTSRVNHTHLALKPLEASASRELVQEILRRVQPLPEELVDLLVRTAEGNPFFIEELVTMLVEDGVILKPPGASEGAWTVDLAQLSSLRVPPSLTAVLQARFANLPFGEKHLLQHASVIGRIFWDRLLESLQDDGRSIQGALSDLQERELIYARASSEFADTREYIFKHNLLRDVVYESVLKSEKAILHARVADWLAEVGGASRRGEDLAVMVAEHYDLGGKLDDAAGWYLHAARRAMTQAAFGEARRLFERSLEILPENDRERRARALIGRNGVLGMLGEREARQADDAALVSLASKWGDDDLLSEASFHQGSYFSVTGDDRLALKCYETGLQAAKRAGNSQQEANILSVAACSRGRLGESAAAIADGERALELARGAGDDTVLLRVLVNLSVLYTELGDISRAIQYLQEQIRINSGVGNRYGEAFADANLGYNYLMLGSWDTGIETLQRSLELATAIGGRIQCAYNLLNLGLAYWRSGESETALKDLDQAGDYLAHLGDRYGLAIRQTYLGLAQEGRKDFSAARTYFETACGQFAELGVEGYAADAQAGLARACLAAGELEPACQHAQRVWDYLAQAGPSALELPILAYLTCQQVFAACGNDVQAEAARLAGCEVLIERADKISDPAWRISYLEAIPENKLLWQSMQSESREHSVTRSAEPAQTPDLPE